MSQAKIHPTAIVDSKAKIGAGVAIGPYCVIGPEVIIGAGSTIQSHVVLEGRVAIGEGNMIGHGAIIGAPPQDLAFTPDRKTSVEIGDNNVIRELCTIHRGSPEGTTTKVGSNNFFMVGAHIGHNCAIGNNVIIANNCLLAGHVRVDHQAFLGGGSTFHQHMRVGRLVMVQGSSAFGKDLPPFTLCAERNSVMGLNVVGLKRNGFSLQDRDEIKAAFKLIYLSGLNTSQALEKAASIKVGAVAREFFNFVAEGKNRGLCPYRGKGEGKLEV